MGRSLLLASTLTLFTAFTCAAQSSTSTSQQDSANSQAQPQSPTPAPTPAPASAAAGQDKDKQDKTKKKPKKVWTNDEISTVTGGVSVVGDSSASASAQHSRNSAEFNANRDSSSKDKRVASYRGQLQELRAQLEAADKKINDTRNFKADNTSSSGGINMSKGYSMTPIEDQIKQMEEKKKQIQARIDALEDEARKNGIEPGQLR